MGRLVCTWVTDVIQLSAWASSNLVCSWDGIRKSVYVGSIVVPYGGGDGMCTIIVACLVLIVVSLLLCVVGCSVPR